MMQPDRTQAPPFQLSSDYTLTQPEISVQPSGLKCFAFRDLQQKAVKVEWIFQAGRWNEPHAGVSHFAAQMLTKGTKKHNAFSLAEKLDSLGAHLEIVPGYDHTSINLYALTKNLDAALDLIAEILHEPVFDEQELSLMKDIFIQGLRVNNEKTSYVASRELRKCIFGASHPYGSPLEEPEVKAIERGVLTSFYRDRFHPDSIFVVGQVTDAHIARMEAMVGGIHGESGEPDRPVQGSPSLRIPMAGKVQSSIRIGMRCVRKADSAEYFDALLFNHVLGGFFGSRLMKNIREDKGLTYGIYSSMQQFKHDSFWAIGAEVNKENTEEAIREIQSEVRRLQEEPVPADELEIATNYFIGSWQTDNATLFSVAEKFKNMHVSGLPADYYQHMMERLRSLTSQELMNAARKFNLDQMIEVVAG